MESSLMNGFTAIRLGLLEHIETGRFALTDLGIYTYLHMRRNWASGICFTNARSIATTFDVPHSTVKDSFRRLKEKGYIDYPEGNGARGSYPVLLLKCEPTEGVLKASRLISRADNNFQAIVYEFPSCDRPLAILTTARQRPDTVLWTAADRLLTVPLQDLQDRARMTSFPKFKNVNPSKRGRKTKVVGA